MDTISAENLYGECRCCLAKGNHRDIMKEYYFNGVREVYVDIFKECLNLSLSTNRHLPTQICTNCIGRLRDACSFRMMVVSTERHLLQQATRNKDTEFVDMPVEQSSLDTDVKSEDVTVKMELMDSSDSHIDYDSDFISADNLIKSHCIKDDSTLVEGEAELLGRHRRVKPLPTRDSIASMLPQFAKHLELLANVTMTPSLINKLKSTSASEQKATIDNMFMSEKSAHINNAIVLLQYSNVTPFKSKSRAGFPCFYCRCSYENFDKLREHITQDHTTRELQKVLKMYGSENLIVYVDVKDLRCTLCDQDLPNINELKSHLTKIHSKNIISDVTDRVIPFRIDSNMYHCQLCAGKFETFGAVERHMNGHYRNYVCKDCGAGFITKYRLKVHLKNHLNGSFPCEVCGKVYKTQQKYTNHVNSVHKMKKRFKCVRCPERFLEYFKRVKHMVEVHGEEPLKYTCNVCDRSFNRRYTLSRHLKRDHLEERDFQCVICAYKCFTNNELKVHMIKHNGERIFECSVCKKSYARKKTLREHMRIHNNDRRFVCPVCGQAFVQKCSLKGHIKTHHLEYNLKI